MLLISGSLTFVIVVFLSWMINRAILKIATSRSILDYPNPRSLHDTPTPRGGGVAIAILVLTCLSVLLIFELVSMPVYVAIMIGGFLVFITGLVDDLIDVHVLIKGISYLLASIWTVYWLSSDNLYIEHIGIMQTSVAVVVITWLINLYNFMDGSDGLSGLTALLICLPLCLIAFLLNHEFLYYLMLVMAASTAGFLIFNLPPARIFMGDAGSCFIGYVFGAAALYCYLSKSVPLAVWFILLSLFVCDASLTLLMRLFSRETWYLGHRKHAYQKFIIMNESHRALLLIVLGLFLVWIYPLAILAYFFSEYSITALVVCYGLLIMLWGFVQYRFKIYSDVSEHD